MPHSGGGFGLQVIHEIFVYNDGMSIVDWIYPKICAGCAKEGAYICSSCAEKLITPPALCPECCRLSIGGWVHPRCRHAYGLDRLIVGLPYKGPIQNALKKVKYKNAWTIIPSLFEVWMNRVGIIVREQDNFCITSVPMFPRKERERGFNQADVFAAILGEQVGIKKLVMLERTRETKPMFGLTKRERKENVRGAFRVLMQRHAAITEKQVILVDDVWTTGATMREAAHILKRGGVGSVWAVALAR